MRGRLDHRSPFAVLVVTVGAIFLSEFGVMFVLPRGLSPLAEAALDATVLIAVLLPLLRLFLVRPMARRIAETERIQAELLEARGGLEQRVQERTAEVEAVNCRLHASVAELERRNREAALLAELADLVHGCTTTEEVHRVTSRMGPQLFPATSGALFTFSPSRDDLEAVAKWGDRAAAMGERMVEPGKCWALRRGRSGRADGLCDGSACLAAGGEGNALCIPLMAQAESLGVLHLQESFRGAAVLESGAAALNEQLAATAAEQVALALANLRLRDTLRNQSIRDPLTGLFNRRYMEETLAREIRRAERSRRPLALIMLDLDHFKRFNDNFGHEAGDALLRAMGGVFRANIRGSDVGCRFGGEEFLLILPECDLGDARARAEDLRERIGRLTVVHLGRSVGAVTVSLGVAVFPDHGSDPETVLRAADGALYRAKQAGRDRLFVADTGAGPKGAAGSEA